MTDLATEAGRAACSNKARPLVSVVIPTYNRAHCLMRAVRSVLAQTYDNLELIIADDNSSDGTEELVRSIDDPRVVYVKQSPNQGAAAARNLGIQHVKGELIAFQDSDDEWVLDKLEFQVATIQELGEEYGATFGGKLIYGRDPAGNFGEGLTYYRPEPGETPASDDLSMDLVRGNLISPQTLMVRTKVVEEIGAFDVRVPANNDWEFMIRLAQATKIRYTYRPVVLAYIMDDSISRNLRKRALSFMIILRKLAPVLKRDPKVYQQRMFVTAGFLRQLGRRRAAGRMLRRAISLNPWAWQGWARLALLTLGRVTGR